MWSCSCECVFGWNRWLPLRAGWGGEAAALRHDSAACSQDLQRGQRSLRVFICRKIHFQNSIHLFWRHSECLKTSCGLGLLRKNPWSFCFDLNSLFLSHFVWMLCILLCLYCCFAVSNSLIQLIDCSPARSAHRLMSHLSKPSLRC